MAHQLLRMIVCQMNVSIRKILRESGSLRARLSFIFLQSLVLILDLALQDKRVKICGKISLLRFTFEKIVMRDCYWQVSFYTFF